MVLMYKQDVLDVLEGPDFRGCDEADFTSGSSLYREILGHMTIDRISRSEAHQLQVESKNLGLRVALKRFGQKLSKVSDEYGKITKKTLKFMAFRNTRGGS